MTISRSWMPNEDDPRWNSETYYDLSAAKCDGLAQWWSQLNNEIEYEGFTRDSEYDREPFENDWPRPSWFEHGENDPEYLAELAQVESEVTARETARKANEAMRQSQIDYCERELATYGARMQRPYEHWNEDEKLMAYLERDR